MKTLKMLLAPLYWRTVRWYWRSPVRNGTPHADHIQRYLHACGRVNDLGGR